MTFIFEVSHSAMPGMSGDPPRPGAGDVRAVAGSRWWIVYSVTGGQIVTQQPVLSLQRVR